MSAWFAMRLKQTLFDSPGVPLPEKRSTATNSLVPPLLMVLLRILKVPVPVPPRAPARRPTPWPVTVLPLTSAAMVPLPSTTRLMPKPGLLLTLVVTVLLAIVPRSEDEPFAATLMLVPARTLTVGLFVTENVCWPLPEPEMLIDDWPPLVNDEPVIETSDTAVLPASTWMLSEVLPAVPLNVLPVTTVWKFAVPELNTET